LAEFSREEMTKGIRKRRKKKGKEAFLLKSLKGNCKCNSRHRRNSSVVVVVSSKTDPILLFYELLVFVLLHLVLSTTHHRPQTMG
jgi:hypothetical protein